MKLENKVVFITGGGKGIGRETALAFAKEDSKVIITYHSSEQKAKELIEEMGGEVAGHSAFALDVTKYDSIENCVKNIIEKYNQIDVLVNNAGVISWKPFLEQTNEEIRNQVESNLIGLMNTTQIVLPYLQKQPEAIIVNIGSTAAKQGYAETVTYGASKFGVRGFTQGLAQELSENVRAYIVNPGLTATSMTENRGVPASEVAKIIVNTAKENVYNIPSGGDVDVDNYL